MSQLIVNKEKACPEPLGKGHRIRRVVIIGGFLDGTDIELSERLSCIIGGRGAGKSTLLELIRYALNAFGNCSDGDRKRVQDLVEANLGGGRIIVYMKTTEDLEYAVSRTAKELPVILNPEGDPSDIAFNAGDFICADIYSQNHIENLASTPSAQLNLLDGFEHRRIEELNQQIAPVVCSLEQNSSEILSVTQMIADLDADVRTLPVVEGELRRYSRGNTKAIQAINNAFAAKAAREREHVCVERAKQMLLSKREKLEDLIGRLAKELRWPDDSEVTEDNRSIMTEGRQNLENTSKKVDSLLRKALQVLDEALKKLNLQAKELLARHNRQEMEYRKIIEKRKKVEEESSQRAAWQSKHNDLMAKKRELTETQLSLEQQQAERARLLKKLRTLRRQRFNVRKGVAERISQELEGQHIRVSITESGDHGPLRELLEKALKSPDIRHGVVARKIASRMGPDELVTAVADGKVSTLVECAEINSNQAKFVITSLAGSETLLQAQILELPDRPLIELRHGKTYKGSQQLSTGQKCTAILPILLLDSVNPLLVDEPDSHLDNAFVYETIVKALLKVKGRRQLVFITHNANIPVLGDAEKVFVLESDGDHGRIVNQGDVFKCKEDIMSLLEGGEEAYHERGKRYGDEGHPNT